MKDVLTQQLTVLFSLSSYRALAKSKQRFWNQTRHCISARGAGLMKHQVAVCKQHLELMAVLVHASRDAMTVCQQLFHDRRWNCSSVNAAPSFLNDLKGGKSLRLFFFFFASDCGKQFVLCILFQR